MNVRLAWAVCLAVVSGSASAATFHTDDFESTIDPQQEWFGGGGALGADTTGTTVATGGPIGGGDGFLRIDSPGGFLAGFNARSDWTGDYTLLATANRLRVNADLMSPVGSETLAVRLVMFGVNGDRWTSTAAQAIPADNVWRNYNFSLAPTALTLVSGSGTHAELVGGVERVMFRHDPGAPSAGGTDVDGTLNLDNIELEKIVLAGDFDDNTVVNGVDLTHPTLGWKARFGVDLDGNDFLTWQRNVGAALSEVAVQAVPEGKSLTLALAMAAALAWVGRKRNRV